MISAWSYSRLTVFEQCPYRVKLAYVDKLPEPERPLPLGKTEHANDRGTRIHLAAEMFVKENIELIPELSKFADELLELKNQYQNGKVSLEGEWGFDRNWEAIAWMDPKVWLRVKLDAMVWLSDTEALVIDYKTGRKYGNEIKHGEQANLYQLAAFMRYPDLQHVTTELWYTDQDEVTRMKYTREQGMRFLRSFDERGAALTDATVFLPRPSIFNCRWCPYAPHASNACDYGIRTK